MKILRDEQGQMLILTVLSMTVLLGVLAFATDIGVLFRAKRNLQITADAAATAGALDLENGAATAAVKADGANVANSNLTALNYSTSTATVTINTPPLYGYHTTGLYVEAIVTTPNPTFFMNMFGFNSMNVTARAVAGVVSGNAPCVIANQQITFQGSATINAINGGYACGVQDNGNLSVVGNGNNIYAAYVDVSGTQPSSGKGSGTITDTNTNFNVAPEPDPFHNTITDGQPSGVPPTCGQTIAGNSYSGTFTGTSDTEVVCFTGTNVNINGATLTNGVFVFENGVQVGTGATITNGTLDLYGGTYDQASTALLNITAPQDNSAWNNGIALMVPGTNVTYPNNSTYGGNTTYTNNYSCQSATGKNAYQNVLQVQWGASGQTFSGWIYAPTTTVEIQDAGGGGVTYSGLYVGSLCQTAGTINLPSYDSKYPLYSPIKVVALVE